MEQGPAGNSAGELMVFGLMEQADRIGKSVQGTQHALTEQIGELAQLQQWAVQAALDLQKRADAGILNLGQQTAASVGRLEAERVQLHAVRVNLERNAVQAIQDAVGKQSDGIERRTEQALAAPLRDIQLAAAQVRQNIKDVNRLFLGIVFLVGILTGLLMGYTVVMRTQNRMDDRLDRIEQFLSTPPQPVPAAPDTHKGKGK